MRDRDAIMSSVQHALIHDDLKLTIREEIWLQVKYYNGKRMKRPLKHDEANVTTVESVNQAKCFGIELWYSRDQRTTLPLTMPVGKRGTGYTYIHTVEEPSRDERPLGNELSSCRCSIWVQISSTVSPARLNVLTTYLIALHTETFGA